MSIDNEHNNNEINESISLNTHLLDINNNDNNNNNLFN